jgi:phenylalanyl-tRNA synthetase beta chain
MKISLEWLKKYVPIDIPIEELATKLTLAGLEVENIEYLGKKYENFVIGKVITVAKHPNADKLFICDVNIGKEDITLVCGASNVTAGQKVIVGLPGAIVPRNQHDPNMKPYTLSRVSIRGFLSNGMICSEFELDLGDDKNGILILPENSQVGIGLAEYLGKNDVVLEIGITPNRPDCLSHLGIAREVAALLGKKLLKPKIKLKESKSPISKFVSVSVKNKSNCPRYTARVLRNVKVEASPAWLQNFLTAVGVRPINNIVDVTNFVLMETGHPLHAFDYDTLSGHSIIVRDAQNGEHFVTLDEKGHELQKGMLLICDNEKPIALAGVMGGINSEISETTTNVFLESAYFNPQSIRRISKTLGIITDASQRFERGADPNITDYAVDRASQLIMEISSGELLKGQIDIYPRKINSKKINVSVNSVNKILGINITSKEIQKLLTRIELTPSVQQENKNKSGIISVEIPTFRPDIEKEIDIIEETARLFGYDKIETKVESLVKFSSNSPMKDLKDEIRNWIAGRGYNEIITNSLQKFEQVSEQWLSDGKSDVDVVKILNPISREMSAMRTSLVPSMLEVVRHNLFHQQKNLNIFEIGKTYYKSSETHSGLPGFVENELLIIGKTGLGDFPNWAHIERFSDIYDIKGVVEDLFRKILLDKYKFIPYSISKALLDTGLYIEIQNVAVGYIGKISKNILKSFDIEQDVFIAEIDLEKLDRLRDSNISYQSLASFPTVVRDLAFIVEKKYMVADILDTIKLSAGSLLCSVDLFDLYEGGQVEINKKSCAFTLQFLSGERTLTENEIEKIVDKIVNEMSVKYNAVLRSKK